jgi:hypothetical protein
MTVRGRGEELAKWLPNTIYVNGKRYSEGKDKLVHYGTGALVSTWSSTNAIIADGSSHGI